MCHSVMRFLVTHNLLPAIKPQETTDPTSLSVWIGGKQFANPIGVGAGFDSVGKSLPGVLRLGYGFCEVGSCASGAMRFHNSVAADLEKGSVTWTDSYNISPLPGTKAVLTKVIDGMRPPGRATVGISIGLAEETTETVPYLAKDDLAMGVQEFMDTGDYVVVNLTAPKPTIGIDQFRDPPALEELLATIKEKREHELGIIAACEYETAHPDLVQSRTDIPPISAMYRRPLVRSHIPPLVFIKVPADLKDNEIATVAGLAEKYSIDGIIVGGVESVRKCYAATQGRVPIISSGGIMDGKEAYRRIKAGASLVQVCSAVLLKGPYVGIQILSELSAEMRKDGVARISDAIGKDHVSPAEPAHQ